MNGSQSLSGVRVGVLAMDGFEQVELTIPVARLRKEGAAVTVVSLRPGRIRGMNAMFPGKKVKVDKTIVRVDAADFDALLLPGGFINPDFLRQSDRVLDLVREFDRSGKPIAVICHGPWVLVSADLVKGRRLASWPGIRDDVQNAGGTWVDEAAVRDGNWISSRSPLDMLAFNNGMVSLFAELANRGAPAHPQVLPRRNWPKLFAGAAVAALAVATVRRLNSPRFES
jgi:protease I